jgi:predicted dithiol-disulfide oxidoreductase (DUF899 family)
MKKKYLTTAGMKSMTILTMIMMMNNDKNKRRWYNMKLDYEYIFSQEEIRKHIQDCEGKHTQQAVYSTFHDALTQICYGCLKIRSNIKR